MTSISRRVFLQSVTAATLAHRYSRNSHRRRATRRRSSSVRADRLKTVWLDLPQLQCVDYKKAAAFYATLMGWKVRSRRLRQRCSISGGTRGGS